MRILLSVLIVTSVYASAVTAQGVFEEIVVTAQKREENLQDVPVSVTAFSGEAVRELGFENSTDIVAHIANLSFGVPVGEGNTPVFAMRGVGLNDFGDANEGPVAMYIDGVYMGTQVGQTLQLFDLERVEALRGPQGTLYGRNTTGGLLHFISKKPTEEFEAYGEVTYGSHDTINFEGALSGPLASDKLLGRVSFRTNNADGYMDNRLGADGNDRENISVRGQLHFLPADNLDVLLNVHAGDVDQNAAQYAHLGTLSADAAGALPCSTEQAWAGGCFDAQGYRDTDDDLYETDQNFVGPLAMETFGVNGTINFNLGNGVEFVSITGYEEVKRHYTEDSDASPSPAAGPTHQNVIATFVVDAEQFSQEVRLSGEHRRLLWQLGAYYFDDTKKSFDGDDVQVLINGFSGITVGPNRWEQDTSSWAVFGQLDYRLTERLTAVAGVRYTEEDKDFLINAEETIYDFLGTLIFGSPDPVNFPTFVDTRRSIKEDNVSGKAGLDFRLNDNVLLYAGFSAGFKSGGFNGSYIDTPGQEEPFDKEILYAYEAGIKGDFMNSRLRANASVFYYDYQDMQYQFFPFLGTAFFGNGDAEVYGAELELMLTPVENFEAILGLGLLDTKADEGFDTGLEGQDFTGNELVLSPDVTLNGIFRYFHALGDTGNVSLQVDFNYMSDHYFSIDNSPFHFHDDYSVWNGRIGYKSASERYSISFAVENIFDKEYLNYSVDFTPLLGMAQLMPGRPRWYSVTLGVSF